MAATDNDWQAAVTALTGLSGMSDEDKETVTDMTWLKIHGTWAVERASLRRWLAEQLDDASTIGFITRRMIADGLISAMRTTTRNHSSVRVHTLNQRRLHEVYEEFDAN